MKITLQETQKQREVDLTQSKTNYIDQFIVDGKEVSAKNDPLYFDTKRPDGMMSIVYDIPPGEDPKALAAALVEKIQTMTAGRDVALVKIPGGREGDSRFMLVFADELEGPSFSADNEGKPVKVPVTDADGNTKIVEGELLAVKDEIDEDSFFGKLFHFFMASLGSLGALGGVYAIVMAFSAPHLLIAGFLLMIGGALAVGGASTADQFFKEAAEPNTADENRSEMLKPPSDAGTGVRTRKSGV